MFEVKEKKTVFAKGYILKVPAEKSNLKEIRKEHGHMFGGAGVYLFLTESCPDSEGRSKIYAGKARHLDSRANDKKRLEGKDFLFLIKKGEPDGDESMHMDENWLQQIEHLLIRDLMSKQAHVGFECSNRSYESKSLAKKESIIQMNKWYETLKKKLIEEFQLRQFGDKPINSKVRKPLLFLQIKDFVHSNPPIEFFGKDLIKVPKGTSCRTSQKAGISLEERKMKFSVDIPYQEYKKELIANKILEWDGDGERWEFKKDQWFTSLSQMAAIVNNTQKGASIWEAKRPNETEWVGLSEHREWKK